ncbi:hypothetical protein K474DRAFT_1655943 [Panus rudis PR-1116 ss-1]|nr:hypothetical protein K474DRAFT_1655943 [Panus rudis PR-1116 ss-1]
MPNLDGVSATMLIRKFDHLTPIISVTSNSHPEEVVSYYSSGMNDVLPKPFTRDGVFGILEVRRFFSFRSLILVVELGHVIETSRTP